MSQQLSETFSKAIVYTSARPPVLPHVRSRVRARARSLVRSPAGPCFHPLIRLSVRLHIRPSTVEFTKGLGIPKVENGKAGSLI